MNDIKPEFGRRSDDTVLLLLVQKIHEDVKEVRSDVTGLTTRLDVHMHNETLALAEAVATLMVKSFPQGDPDGHKALHEADIQAAKDKAEFWKKMRFELSRAGLLAFLIWAGVQIWKGALAGPSS
jgi:hypothetical protein